nr:alpha/beta hydrolase [uncultured Desulfuromonas sp.]
MGQWLNRRNVILCVMILGCALCGCTPPTRTPLPILSYTQNPRQPNLLVILRGIGGDSDDFERLGAIDAVRRHGLPFDVVVPDAHYGYYKKRILIERLYDDVIAPAKQQGYQQIWLAGFSMGGLGSLLYVRERAQDIDGILLITPFLGWDAIIHEIKDAGGVANWHPGPFDPVEDWQRMLWSWIKNYQQDPTIAPPIYLGYAEDDGVADEGPPLLATVLPPCRSFYIPGGHDNNVMLAIFRHQLNDLSQRLSVKTGQ